MTSLWNRLTRKNPSAATPAESKGVEMSRPSASDGKGIFQPVKTYDYDDNEEDEQEGEHEVPVVSANSLKARDPASLTVVRPHKVQRGCHLEFVVQILTLMSMLVSLGNIALSLKVYSDGSWPGVTITAWVYVVSATLGWDFCIFVLAISLMVKTFRTSNTLADDTHEAFPDEWYHTYWETAFTSMSVSAYIFTLIIIYYYRYAGEEAFAASRYNIPDWAKPIQWLTAHGFNAGLRIILLLRTYLPALRQVREPMVITRPPAPKNKGV